MPSFNTLVKIAICVMITAVTTHAHDRHKRVYGAPGNTVTERITNVTPGYSNQQNQYKQQNVKSITNLRTGEEITSINDPSREQSAGTLVNQYGSHQPNHSDRYSASTQHTVVVINEERRQPATRVYTETPAASTSYSNSSYSHYHTDRAKNTARPAPSAPPPTTTKHATERDPLLSMDIESGYHHTSAFDTHNSSTRMFNAKCCMNIFKVTALSVVVICLFAGSYDCVVHGSVMMAHAGPNAKQVPYITHSDDDRTFYTDDVRNEYHDDDYIKMINGDPHHVQNHHHLVPVHTRLKHVINNHFHEVTRYRCEGSGCNEYYRGESYHALGIIGILGTAVGTFFLIVNQCFVEDSND